MKPSKWTLLQNPTLYQGWNRADNYFEGWYFKIVDPGQNLAFALIPGISKSKDAHAFIQFIDGVKCDTAYYRYGIEKFKAKADRFEVTIEEQVFSESNISFATKDISINLTQSPYTKIRSSILQPGIMGWYTYMPFMQCYHGLVSMNHYVSGQVQISKDRYELKNAKCYVEKDWGVSFPKCWIWNQCNTFKSHDDLSVFASVAHIPWLGSQFIGFIAAIYFKGKIEIFATYNRSKRITAVDGNHLRMVFAKGHKKLEIESIKEEGAELKSPLNGEMVSKVNESLLATMKLRYSQNDKILIEDSGSFAGMELAGPVKILLK